MEEIQDIKNRIINIITEFGDGETVFQTNDINRLVNECDEVETLMNTNFKLFEKCKAFEDELLKYQELIKWINNELEIDTDENILPPNDFIEKLYFRIKKLDK